MDDPRTKVEERIQVNKLRSIFLYQTLNWKLLFQLDTLNWIVSSSTNSERFDFLRRILLDVLPEEELPGVLKLVSKAKKRRKRSKNSVSVPAKFVSAPENGWYRQFKQEQFVSIDVEKVRASLYDHNKNQLG
jgi:hypothetical protein